MAEIGTDAVSTRSRRQATSRRSPARTMCGTPVARPLTLSATASGGPGLRPLRDPAQQHLAHPFAAAFQPAHEHGAVLEHHEVRPADGPPIVNHEGLAEGRAAIRRERQLQPWRVLGRGEPRDRHAGAASGDGRPIGRAAGDVPAVTGHGCGLGPAAVHAPDDCDVADVARQVIAIHGDRPGAGERDVGHAAGAHVRIHHLLGLHGPIQVERDRRERLDRLVLVVALAGALVGSERREVDAVHGVRSGREGEEAGVVRDVPHPVLEDRGPGRTSIGGARNPDAVSVRALSCGPCSRASAPAASRRASP